MAALAIRLGSVIPDVRVNGLKSDTSAPLGKCMVDGDYKLKNKGSEPFFACVNKLMVGFCQ